MNIPKRFIALGPKHPEHGESIHVSHVTIHQSISILAFRLFLVEFAAVMFVVLFHVLFVNTHIIHEIAGDEVFFNTFLFLTLSICKFGVSLFILLQWVNEYYEITTKALIHKKGIFIKREEKYAFEHIRTFKLEQGVMGRIFNYGTIKLRDWILDRTIYIYLIHNPYKFQHILRDLLPAADMEKKVFREHILDRDEEEDEE